ncbi:hypothetical protein HanRHA438_Chr09g0420601 [Helianthus annuus]|nr:hypothetical protein HanRHA438_Chr09g0420601 [Helianthus annuus]
MLRSLLIYGGRIKFQGLPYILDVERRSSSTKNRTRHRYTLPHFATL